MKNNNLRFTLNEFGSDSPKIILKLIILIIPLCVPLITEVFYSSGGHLWDTIIFGILLSPYLVICIFKSFNFKRLCISVFDIVCVGLFLVYSIYFFLGDKWTTNLNTYTETFLLTGFFLVLKRHVRDYLRFFIIVVLFVAALYGIFGVVEFFFFPKEHYAFQIGRVIGNPGTFGILISSFIPLSLVFVIEEDKEYWLTLCSAVVSLILIANVVISESRTAILSVIISIIYLMISSQYRNIKKIYLKVIIGFTPVLVLIFFLLTRNFESVLGRLFIWKVSLNSLVDAPFLGHGFNNYLPVHSHYQSKFFEANDSVTDSVFYNANDLEYAFNDYIEILVEFGIVGLLFFIPVIILMGISGKERKYIYVKAGLLIFLVSAFFSYPFQVFYIKVFFVLLMSILYSSSSKYTFRLVRLHRLVFASFLAIYCIFWFGLITYSVHNKYFEYTWIRVVEQARMDYSDQTPSYEKEYLHIENNPYFLYNYGTVLSKQKRYRESLNCLIKASEWLKKSNVYSYIANNYERIDQYDSAIIYYQKAKNLIPHLYYPRYRLIHCYVQVGKIDLAMELAIDTLKRPPKIDNGVANKMQREIIDFVNRNEKTD